jgi:hypothetical protein
MATTKKRLVPYSVHVPEDLLVRLKKLAKDRQASAMVRDAITMALDGSTVYEAGYRKAVKDCISLIKDDTYVKIMNQEKHLEKKLKELL